MFSLNSFLSPSLPPVNQITPLPPSLCAGAVSGCRCVARVQAPGSTYPQVDGVALQPLQGGVGLAYPAAGHLHCHPDTLLSSVPPQRPGGVSSWNRILNLPAVRSSQSDFYCHVINRSSALPPCSMQSFGISQGYEDHTVYMQTYL